MMTVKRKRFAQYLLSGLNQTQAAIKAGYKESSAKAVGSQLANNTEVKEYINELEQLDTNYSKPVGEEVDLALLCRDPIQKLIELMNCDDVNIEKEAAKALLPYFYLKKSDTEAIAKLGKKELKEVKAVELSNKSKFATLSNQLPNIYENQE